MTKVHDDLMVALFNKIPEPGSVWPVADRGLWLQACEGVFDLLYGPVDHVSDIPKGFSAKVEESPPMPPHSGPLRRPPGLPTTIEMICGVLKDGPIEGLRAGGIADKIAEKWWPGCSTKDIGTFISEYIKSGKLARSISGFITAVEPPVETAPKTTTAAGGRPTSGRPEGIPSNLDLALEAIAALGGGATAPQIRDWIRLKYWPGIQPHWGATLFDIAGAGKLARDGLKFIAPVTAKPRAAPAPQPEPRHVVTPGAKLGPPTREKGLLFVFSSDRIVTLHQKEWRLAEALKRAMGKGHLDYGFLVTAGCPGERRPASDKVWLADMFSVMSTKLKPIGLEIVHSPNFGYTMKDHRADG